MIPEDAQHITWGTQTTAYSRRDNGWVGGHSGGVIPEDEFLEFWIAGAEVIVLVAK